MDIPITVQNINICLQVSSFNAPFRSINMCFSDKFFYKKYYSVVPENPMRIQKIPGIHHWIFMSSPRKRLLKKPGNMRFVGVYCINPLGNRNKQGVCDTPLHRNLDYVFFSTSLKAGIHFLYFCGLFRLVKTADNRHFKMDSRFRGNYMNLWTRGVNSSFVEFILGKSVPVPIFYIPIWYHLIL